jgi:hypothetical protein
MVPAWDGIMAYSRKKRLMMIERDMVMALPP